MATGRSFSGLLNTRSTWKRQSVGARVTLGREGRGTPKKEGNKTPSARCARYKRGRCPGEETHAGNRKTAETYASLPLVCSLPWALQPVAPQAKQRCHPSQAHHPPRYPTPPQRKQHCFSGILVGEKVPYLPERVPDAHWDLYGLQTLHTQGDLHDVVDGEVEASRGGEEVLREKSERETERER